MPKTAIVRVIREENYFEKLTNPKFLELESLIILEAHYSPKIFELWQKEHKVKLSLPQELQKAENTFNHVHLDGFADDKNTQKEIGEYLREIWVDALHNQFRDYEFECRVEHNKTGWELVLWRKR